MDISEEDDEGFLWFNIFLGRILFDPMHDAYWIKQIHDKIQKKLSAIKVRRKNEVHIFTPNTVLVVEFVNCLKIVSIRSISLGTTIYGRAVGITS